MKGRKRDTNTVKKSFDFLMNETLSSWQNSLDNINKNTFSNII